MAKIALIFLVVFCFAQVSFKWSYFFNFTDNLFKNCTIQPSLGATVVKRDAADEGDIEITTQSILETLKEGAGQLFSDDNLKVSL